MMLEQAAQTTQFSDGLTVRFGSDGPPAEYAPPLSAWSRKFASSAAVSRTVRLAAKHNCPLLFLFMSFCLFEV